MKRLFKKKPLVKNNFVGAIGFLVGCLFKIESWSDMGDLIQRIRTDWHFLVIALTTTAIGLNFLIHPGLLEDKSAYAFIVNVLDDAVFSIPITVSGGVGVLLFLLGKRQFRAVFLVFYQFFWMILLLAYVWRALNGYPNSTWIMALCINSAVFFLALWGDVDVG